MATITGNTLGNAATVANATDSNGVPLQVQGSVSVTTASGATLNRGSALTTLVDSVNGVYEQFSVSMGAGDDTLVGSNMIWTNNGNPTVAFSTINMGDGADSVSLYRSAFRSMDMGAGNDTLDLELSAGQTVSMGTGDDQVNIKSSTVTPTDAEQAQKAGQPAMLIDGGAGTDTLNLEGDWTLTLSTGNVGIDDDGDGTADRSTNIYTSAEASKVVSFPTLLSGTVSYGTVTLGNGTTIANNIRFSNFEGIVAVCFTAGTMIDTPEGQVAIETLREGDLVMTRNGPKALRWIGKRKLDAVDLAGNPKMLPIRVPAGAFGNGLPTRDVSFSPQHRVVIRSAIAERMFGSQEVLVSVKQLIGVEGIDVDGGVRSVEYFHLMFEDHQILTVEGIEAESLYPGRQAISFLSDDQKTELRAIFPDFDQIVAADSDEKAALPFLKGRESRSLAARHAKHGRPFLA